MAFVSERIAEADKGQIDMEKLRAEVPRVQQPIWWVINRERGIYLIDTAAQGGPEIPRRYCLSIQGELVLFHATLTGKGNWDIGVDLSWKVFDLRVSRVIVLPRQKIRQLIGEGLDAYGQGGDRTHVKSVSVHFE